MFDWFRRIFHQRPVDGWGRIANTLDNINADAGGGRPILAHQLLGKLRIPSRTLMIGDPSGAPSLFEIPHIENDEITVSADLWRYPSGMETVVALKIEMQKTGAPDGERVIGEVGIDSAKLVVADKAEIESHWTEVGRDRIGIIPTFKRDMLENLKKRFKLKTIQVNAVRAEIVGNVSDSLAKEITDYLRSIPECADYPFMYFYVCTNNSFDRANGMASVWDFLPIGNSPVPLMFVCGTGRGDGIYEVACRFANSRPHSVFIDFLKLPTEAH